MEYRRFQVGTAGGWRGCTSVYSTVLDTARETVGNEIEARFLHALRKFMQEFVLSCRRIYEFEVSRRNLLMSAWISHCPRNQTKKLMQVLRDGEISREPHAKYECIQWCCVP